MKPHILLEIPVDSLQFFEGKRFVLHMYFLIDLIRPFTVNESYILQLSSMEPGFGQIGSNVSSEEELNVSKVQFLRS